MAVFSGARGENSKNGTELVSSRMTWKFVLLQQVEKIGGDECLLISPFFKEMARLSSSMSRSGTLPSLTHYTYKNPLRHANFQVIVVHTGKLPPPRLPLPVRYLNESCRSHDPHELRRSSLQLIKAIAQRISS